MTFTISEEVKDLVAECNWLSFWSALLCDSDFKRKKKLNTAYLASTKLSLWWTVCQSFKYKSMWTLAPKVSLLVLSQQWSQHQESFQRDLNETCDVACMWKQSINLLQDDLLESYQEATLLIVPISLFSLWFVSCDLFSLVSTAEDSITLRIVLNSQRAVEENGMHELETQMPTT